MTALSSLWAWYTSHQAVIYAIGSTLVVILDWLMARNPNSKYDGALHMIENQIRQLLGMNPSPDQQPQVNQAP